MAGTILAAEVPAFAVSGAPRWNTARRLTSDAVAELLCGFPVYRSYLPEGREALDTALSVARIRRPDLAEQLDRAARGDARRPAAASWPPGCSRRRAW